MGGRGIKRGAGSQASWSWARRPEQPGRGSTGPLGPPAAVERRGQPHFPTPARPETGTWVLGLPAVWHARLLSETAGVAGPGGSAGVCVWNESSIEFQAGRALIKHHLACLYLRTVVFKAEVPRPAAPASHGLVRNAATPTLPGPGESETLGVRPSVFNKPSRAP